MNIVLGEEVNLWELEVPSFKPILIPGGTYPIEIGHRPNEDFFLKEGPPPSGRMKDNWYLLMNPEEINPDYAGKTIGVSHPEISESKLPVTID